MKISIIVPDGIVVVNGIGRKVSMADVSPGVHAVQWRDGTGQVELSAPRQAIVDIDDLSPYQFLLDRWTAAAPPPFVPPTKDEEVQRLLSDRVFKAMIQEIIFRLGLTQQQFVDAVKARLL